METSTLLFTVLSENTQTYAEYSKNEKNVDRYFYLTNAETGEAYGRYTGANTKY